MKEFYKKAIFVAIILITGIIIGRSCSGRKVIQEPNKTEDSLNNVYAQKDKERAALTVKLDSMAKLLITRKEADKIYITRYIQVKQSLTAEDSINCPEVVDKCNTIISACDSVILSKDSIIHDHEVKDSLNEADKNILKDQIQIKDQLYKNEQTEHDKTKKQLRKEKRKKWLFGATGLLSGFGLGKVF